MSIGERLRPVHDAPPQHILARAGVDTKRSADLLAALARATRPRLQLPVELLRLRDPLHGFRVYSGLFWWVSPSCLVVLLGHWWASSAFARQVLARLSALCGGYFGDYFGEFGGDPGDVGEYESVFGGYWFAYDR